MSLQHIKEQLKYFHCACFVLETLLETYEQQFKKKKKTHHVKKEPLLLRWNLLKDKGVHHLPILAIISENYKWSHQGSNTDNFAPIATATGE